METELQKIKDSQAKKKGKNTKKLSDALLQQLN